MRSKGAGRRAAMGRTLKSRYGSSPDTSDSALIGQGRSNLTNALRHHEIPAPAGWVCRFCRQADIGNRPHPQMEAHNPDCTCACYLTWSTPG